MGNKRRHSEEDCRPRKKQKLQSDPDAAAIGEEGETEKVKRKMKAEVHKLTEKVTSVSVETDRKEKPEHKHKHKHKHKHNHKHKHKHKQKHKQKHKHKHHKCTTENSLQGAKTAGYVTGAGDGEMEKGGSEETEGEGCWVHKEHKKHEREQCYKHAVTDEAEQPVPDPLWAAISIEGESSEEEDEFSALHSRWVRLAKKEKQKLWEEGEPTCAHLYRKLDLHVYNLTWLSPFTPLDRHAAAQGDFSVRASVTS